jgi:PAS domain S-box-containing protein
MMVVVIVLGLSTLSEFFFGWHLGIDQLIFHDRSNMPEMPIPGRMSAVTAFCFVLTGCALLAATRRQGSRLRLPTVTALGAAVMVISGFSIIGFVVDTMLSLRWWNFTGMAVNTSAAFLFLGFGLLAVAQSEQKLAWLLDKLTTLGFVIGIMSSIAAAGMSFHFTNQLQQSAEWVSQTQETLKEIEAVSAGVSSLGSSQRSYINTGNEHLLDQDEEIKSTIYEHLTVIQKLDTNDVQQQRFLDQLGPLIDQRVEWGEQVVSIRRQQGLAAAEQWVVAGQGTALSDGIRHLVNEMEGEEYALLDKQQKKERAISTTTILLLPLGVFLSLTMLSLGLFFLNAGVGEQKLAETASIQLAAIVESTDDAIIGKNLDGIITSWNRGAEKLFGYSAEESIGKSMLMLFPPERIREEPEILARIRHGESVNHFETVRVTKSGKPIDVSVTISPVRNNEGQIIGASKIARDISERRRAEENLRASEARLRTVTDNARVGLVMVDRERRYTFANSTYAEILGLQSANIIGQRVADVLAPLYADQICPRLDRAFDGERVTYELHRQTSEGTCHYAVKYEPTKFDGQVSLVVVVITDITERKQAEAVMRESEHRLRNILDTMFVFVGLIDLDGRIVEVNQAPLEAASLKREDVLGRTVAESYWFSHSPTLQTQVSQALGRVATGEISREDYSIRIAGGEQITIDTTFAPLRDASGRVMQIVGSAVDITKRKYAEEQVQLLNTELEKRVVERTAQLKSANEELEAFSYSISHDLRAPLRAVNGFAGIVLEDFGSQLSEEGRDYLQRIRKGGQRMGDLIDDLLAFSRLSRQSMNRHQMDTGKLTQEVLVELKPLMEGRQIEIKAGNLPACAGDRALLRQVWINLISNAIKYTQGRDLAIIEIGCSRNKGEDVFFVRDNGAGFDMKYVNKLFGVFQRLHRADEFEGTGVGLAIVQRIVHRHGGRIWAEAEVDRGATFHFTLEEKNKI